MRLSRGRVSSLLLVPPVLLHTVGAKSGRPRVTPLTYFTDNDRVVLMASNYGGPKHPAWYHNLKANPLVRLQAGGAIGTYRGEEATGPERERLWELAKRHSPNYVRYEETARGVREIPVVVFSPVEDGPAGR